MINKTYDGVHMKTISINNNIGRAYNSLYNFKKGLEYGKKSAKILSKLAKYDPIHNAITYNCIGCDYTGLGNHIQAVRYNAKAA